MNLCSLNESQNDDDDYYYYFFFNSTAQHVLGHGGWCLAQTEQLHFAGDVRESNRSPFAKVKKENHRKKDFLCQSFNVLLLEQSQSIDLWPLYCC